MEQDPDVGRVLQLMDSVGASKLPMEDKSARQWLIEQGANDRMLAIADACHATDFGCSIDDLGLRETIIEHQQWDSGTGSLVLINGCPDQVH